MEKDAKSSKWRPGTALNLSVITSMAMLAITVYLMAVGHVAAWVIFIVMTGYVVIMPIQVVTLGYLTKIIVPQPEDSSPSPR